LAAASSVSAIADLVDNAWVGVGSLTAALLTGMATVVSAKERSGTAADAANAYIEVRDAARQLSAPITAVVVGWQGWVAPA
jgi:hypothetical protein